MSREFGYGAALGMSTKLRRTDGNSVCVCVYEEKTHISRYGKGFLEFLRAARFEGISGVAWRFLTQVSFRRTPVSRTRCVI